MLSSEKTKVSRTLPLPLPLPLVRQRDIKTRKVNRNRYESQRRKESLRVECYYQFSINVSRDIWDICIWFHVAALFLTVILF